MSPAEALADLADLSSQIRVAVVAEREGAVLASTLKDDESAQELASAARAALEATRQLRAHGDAEVSAFEAVVPGGSLFVATDDGVLVAATTGPEEPAGLVLYDLRLCLRNLRESQ